MKIDLIVCWPRNADYPLWRQQLRDDRDKFAKVIIIFTETNMGENYRGFVREAMKDDDVIFIESPQLLPGQDWRNVAVNQALAISDAHWVFFTEQDFFWKSGFWDEVDVATRTIGMAYIGVMDGPRLHPCGLFVNKIALELTRKDFGIIPDKLDHFGMIAEDLEQALERNSLFTKRILDPKLWVHMAGLSHNLRLMSEGEKPNHSVNEFNDYLERCLSVTVPLKEEVVTLYNQYLNFVAVKN